MKALITSAMALSLVLTACGKGEDGSTLDHDFGRTTSLRESELESCKDQAETKNSSLVNEYLRAIAYAIMAKNPSTFSGYLDRKNFCFGLEKYNSNATANAFALPNNGLVAFNAQLLLDAPNDAVIAETMAHELSHVTMNHSDTPHAKLVTNKKYNDLSEDYAYSLDDFVAIITENASMVKRSARSISAFLANVKVSESDRNFDNLFKSLSEFEEYGEEYPVYAGYLLVDFAKAPLKNIVSSQKLQKASSIIASYSSIKTQLVSASAQIEAAALKRDTFGDTVIGENGASQNWREQEADEVGFELFRRAGLPSTSYFWYHKKYIEDDNATTTCAIERARGKIIRGSGTHPTSCWRYYNLVEKEQIAHQAQYAKYPEGSTTILPGKLNEVKAFLKSYMR